MKKTIVIILVLAVFAVSAHSWAKESKVLEGTININTASVTELMLLPGVGEVKAKAIADARAQKPFAKQEDLLAVNGIGEKLLAKIAPYLVFDGKTSLAESSKKQEAGKAVQ